MIVYSCNPYGTESETGGLLSEASLGLIVETLSQEEQKQLIVMALPLFQSLGRQSQQGALL